MEKLRKVLKIGNGFYVSIPIPFIRRNGIRHGDKLEVKAGRKRIIFSLISEKARDEFKRGDL